MATGMIQDNMSRPEGDELTLDTVRENIKMPPELQEAYERVVVAGMKVMFSKETHRLMLKEIQAKGPVGERIGKGVMGLMLLLFKESNETMPPAVIMPAAVELIMQVADFLKQGGLEKVTNEDVSTAIEVMISGLLDKFGVDSGGLKQVLNQYDGSNLPSAPQPPAQGAQA